MTVNTQVHPVESPIYREGDPGRLQDLPKLFTHISDDNCLGGDVPYINQFSPTLQTPTRFPTV